MKTKTTSLLGSAIAAIALTLSPAGAATDRAAPSPLDDVTSADTYDGCRTGYGYRGSYNRGSGHYSGGYRSGGHYRSSHSYSTSTRCRVIGREYFHRGCYRYCRITYRHETVDCYGRVLRCWTSCKTVRA
jgi:hypothetical protein